MWEIQAEQRLSGILPVTSGSGEIASGSKDGKSVSPLYVENQLVAGCSGNYPQRRYQVIAANAYELQLGFRDIHLKFSMNFDVSEDQKLEWLRQKFQHQTDEENVQQSNYLLSYTLERRYEDIACFLVKRGAAVTSKHLELAA